MPKYKNILQLSKRGIKRRLSVEPCNSTINPRSKYFEYASRTSLNSDIMYVENNNSSTLLQENDIENQEPCVYDSDGEMALSNFEFEYGESRIERTYDDVADYLRNWTIEFNVNHSALNKLLTFLKKNGFPYLPEDSRTLLKTPNSNAIKINSVF